MVNGSSAFTNEGYETKFLSLLGIVKKGEVILLIKKLPKVRL